MTSLFKNEFSILVEPCRCSSVKVWAFTLRHVVPRVDIAGERPLLGRELEREGGALFAHPLSAPQARKARLLLDRRLS